ncbi:MAG: PulJ/GspJ family protein [Candidatus Binatia bacterium]
MKTIFRCARSATGMTLTELVLVSTLISSISAMVYTTFVHQTQAYRQQSAQSMTQDNLRVWLDRIVKDVRRAGYDPRETGLFAVESFSSTEFRFKADTDSDGVLDAGSEYLGYKFEDGTVWLRTGQASWRPLLTGVGGFTFTYRDVKGNLVSTQGPAISSVEVAMSVEVTQTAAEGNETSPSHSPTLTVGAERTTVSVPSTSDVPVYGRIDRASLRNPL